MYVALCIVPVAMLACEVKLNVIFCLQYRQCTNVDIAAIFGTIANCIKYYAQYLNNFPQTNF